MIDERGHDTATLYDQDGKVVAIILSDGTQLSPTPSNVGKYVRAWDDRCNTFIMIGPVAWDGAAPDLHGGFTHGELMPPSLNAPEPQFRIGSQLPSLELRLKLASPASTTSRQRTKFE